MRKIVILIPFGVQTGGPEALHQLSDSLLAQGHDATVWYVLPGDEASIEDLHQRNALGEHTVLQLQRRENTIEGYANYRTVAAESIKLNADTSLVFPEIYGHWARYFGACRNVIWWLSIDSAFNSMGSKHANLNRFRSERVLHAYQSGYARGVLQALGFPRLLPLSDYTPEGQAAPAVAKTDIAMNANAKVIFDVQAIAARLSEQCGTQVHMIRGMTRLQVYDALSRSKLFIDFGSFPGKDRLAREALTRDCCIFALDVGAAREYGLPEECYFGADQTEQVYHAAARLLQQYELYHALSLPARQAVQRERMVFDREVAALAQALDA